MGHSNTFILKSASFEGFNTSLTSKAQSFLFFTLQFPRPFDQIISVNGSDLTCVSNREAVRILRESGDTLAMVGCTQLTSQKMLEWEDSGMRGLYNYWIGYVSREREVPPPSQVLTEVVGTNVFWCCYSDPKIIPYCFQIFFVSKIIRRYTGPEAVTSDGDLNSPTANAISPDISNDEGIANEDMYYEVLPGGFTIFTSLRWKSVFRLVDLHYRSVC